MLKIFLTNLHHFYHHVRKQLYNHHSNMRYSYIVSSDGIRNRGYIDCINTPLTTTSLGYKCNVKRISSSINVKIASTYTTNNKQSQNKQQNSTQNKIHTPPSQQNQGKTLTQSIKPPEINIDNRQIQNTHNVITLLKNIKSYGYYDWDNDQTFKRATHERYMLNDLIYGFRRLKQRNIQYNQYHVNFMAYVAVLYPEIQDQIFEVFKPAFEKLQQNPTKDRNQQYLKTIKALCNHDKRTFENGQDVKVKKNIWSKLIKPYFIRRLNRPQNFTTLQSIHHSILCNCFQNMGNLTQYFQLFKKVLYAKLIDSRYSLSGQQKKIIIETYQYFILFDQQLRRVNFLSTFPQIYRQDQQCFKKLIQFLLQAISFNSIYFTNDLDIVRLNEKIGTCRNFKSKQTKKLLRKYSEHLVIVNKIQLINFTQILDHI